MRTRRLAAAERLIWSGEDAAEKENLEPPPLPASSSSSTSTTTGEAAASTSSSQGEGDPDVDKSRAVGILFLAHDGVANPALWERWRESDPVRESPL
jgi:hypothetical protein